METAAVIAEFNPFHNGHAHLFREAEQWTGRDGARVVILSGDFTQRGEPALLDKWTRADTALACGADLVLELPFAYAAASAGRFAEGGVAIAAATGICQHLVFGSETSDLDRLSAVAGLLADEPPAFREHLRRHLDAGLPYAKARICALRDTTGEDAAPLESSNSILAVEYLIALKRSGAALRPHAVQRQGTGYREATPASGWASATALRGMARRHGPDVAGLADAVRPYMPPEAAARLLRAVQEGAAPVFWSDLAPVLLGRLRAAAPGELTGIAGMSEGLDVRMTEAAGRPTAGTTEDLFDTWFRQVTTKRFAGTRVRRAAASLLAGLTRQDLSVFDTAPGGPRYLRVLGFNRKGRYLLRIMRKKAALPVIMKGSDFLEYGRDPVLTRMAELDRIATDVRNLALGIPCGRDFDTPPAMV